MQSSLLSSEPWSIHSRMLMAGLIVIVSNQVRSVRPTAAHKPSFRTYLRRRLGPPGPGRWTRFFLHPFTAASFAEFWRRWNPVYGYFLGYHIYRPASRRVPRPAAVMATFLFAGFVLHDLPAWVITRRVLPPGGTIAFSLFGAGLLASQRVGLDLSAEPTILRVAANVTYLAACSGTMLVIARRLARR